MHTHTGKYSLFTLFARISLKHTVARPSRRVTVVDFPCKHWLGGYSTSRNSKRCRKLKHVTDAFAFLLFNLLAKHRHTLAHRDCVSASTISTQHNMRTSKRNIRAFNHLTMTMTTTTKRNEKNAFFWFCCRCCRVLVVIATVAVEKGKRRVEAMSDGNHSSDRFHERHRCDTVVDATH